MLFLSVRLIVLQLYSFPFRKAFGKRCGLLGKILDRSIWMFSCKRIDADETNPFTRHQQERMAVYNALHNIMANLMKSA